MSFLAGLTTGAALCAWRLARGAHHAYREGLADGLQRARAQVEAARRRPLHPHPEEQP